MGETVKESVWGSTTFFRRIGSKLKVRIEIKSKKKVVIADDDRVLPQFGYLDALSDGKRPQFGYLEALPTKQKSAYHISSNYINNDDKWFMHPDSYTKNPGFESSIFLGAHSS